jgi:hypothetical protein
MGYSHPLPVRDFEGACIIIEHPKSRQKVYQPAMKWQGAAGFNLAAPL